jgi:hypothetical protein
MGTWVQEHGYVDLGLQIAALAFLLLLLLIAVSGCVYWGLFLARLFNAANVQDFISKPIPGLRRGKVAGQEFELTEVARAESEAIRIANQTVEELNYRLEGLEEVVRKLAERFERFEDVSGRA